MDSDIENDHNDAENPEQTEQNDENPENSISNFHEQKLKELEGVQLTKSGKVKKPLKDDDKRKVSSAANLAKAREARMAKIAAQREAAKNHFELESSSDEEAEGTELVLSKGKKKVVTESDVKMRELELKLEKANLMIDKLVTQQIDGKTKKVIQLVATAVAEPVKKAKDELKKKYLNL